MLLTAFGDGGGGGDDKRVTFTKCRDVPGTVLSTFHGLTHLILTASLYADGIITQLCT